MVKQILIGVLLIGLGVVVLVMFWGNIGLVMQNYSDLQVMEKTIASGNQLVDSLPNYYSQYQSKVENYTKISNAVAEEFNYSDAVSMVDQLSKRSGLVLSAIDIIDPNDQSASTPYRILELQMAGNYQSLEQFIRLAETSLPFVDIAEFNFSINPGESINNMTVSLNYYYRE